MNRKERQALAFGAMSPNRYKYQRPVEGSYKGIQEDVDDARREMVNEVVQRLVTRMKLILSGEDWIRDRSLPLFRYEVFDLAH